jgi:hypothetical protein
MKTVRTGVVTWDKQAEPVQALLREAMGMIRVLPWESETTGRKRWETFEEHRDRMSDVMERNNIRHDLISAIEATLAQQTEPVAMVPPDTQIDRIVSDNLDSLYAASQQQAESVQNDLVAEQVSDGEVKNGTRLALPNEILDFFDKHFPGQQATIILRSNPEPIVRAIESGESFEVLEKLAADFRKGLK